MIHDLINPKASKALEFIEKYHKSKPEKTLLLIIGDCLIDYRGRARSFLDWGESIIMIKKDGAVIVNKKVMREEVNWKDEGSKSVFYIKDE